MTLRLMPPVWHHWPAGGRDSNKAQATANFDSGLLTKAFRSVIFHCDSPKPSLLEFLEIPLDSNSLKSK